MVSRLQGVVAMNGASEEGATVGEPPEDLEDFEDLLVPAAREEPAGRDERVAAPVEEPRVAGDDSFPEPRRTTNAAAAVTSRWVNGSGVWSGRRAARRMASCRESAKGSEAGGVSGAASVRLSAARESVTEAPGAMGMENQPGLKASPSPTWPREDSTG